MEPVKPPNQEWLPSGNGRFYDKNVLTSLIERDLPLFPTDLSRGEYIFVRNWLEHFQRTRIREAKELIYGFSTNIQTGRTKMLGQLFVDDPFPLLIFDNVITHEMKNLFGETPLEQDFRAWKEKGNWDRGLMSIERGVARWKKRESAVEVWRTLDDAVNGWCVEEYRVYTAFSPTGPDWAINNMTFNELHDAIRRGDLQIVHEIFKESSVANITYKASYPFKYGRR